MPFASREAVVHDKRGRAVKHRVCDWYGLCSKPTRAILLCPWKRHFTALSSAWWSWQSILNFHQYLYKTKKKQNKKFQSDSNILASPEAGQGKC